MQFIPIVIRGTIERMSKYFSYSIPKSWCFLACFVLTVGSHSLVYAQAALAPGTGISLPAGASAKKADEFLSTLRPPTSVKALLSGNDLLLSVPDIARAGPVRAKAVSTIARTDAMWLLNLHPSPDSGSALFVSMQFDVSALPEVTTALQLYKTQPVLLIARASGKYYGLVREVKVGQLATQDASK